MSAVIQISLFSGPRHIRGWLVSQELAVMYRITTSAWGLSAYRSESGSSSATRHTPKRLSQNADQDRCSARNAAIRAAAKGSGGWSAQSYGEPSPPSSLGPCYRPPVPPSQLG